MWLKILLHCAALLPLLPATLLMRVQQRAYHGLLEAIRQHNSITMHLGLGILMRSQELLQAEETYKAISRRLAYLALLGLIASAVLFALLHFLF